MPTTAGTGSEVGRAGVLTNEATRTKKIIFHPKLLPAIVIADPELTTGMPPFITVGTGMDALAHCLEAYSAAGYHPMADGVALEGMRLVFENLPKAVANGKDITARANMMAAAAAGATAFQKGLGAIHSLSHPIGALYDTHHGMTNGVFMPYVLAFNRPAIEDRIARACRLSRHQGRLRRFCESDPEAEEGPQGSAHAARSHQGAEDGRQAQGRDRRNGGRGPEHRLQPRENSPGRRRRRCSRIRSLGSFERKL